MNNRLEIIIGAIAIVWLICSTVENIHSSQQENKLLQQTIKEERQFSQAAFSKLSDRIDKLEQMLNTNK